MLVLTRKAKQQIRLGDNITITVLQVKGNTIRLGVDAPRELPIIRGELEFHVAADTNDASASSPTPSGKPTINLAGSRAGTKLFPRSMERTIATAPEARPLKRFMPKTMRDVVGDVSV